jgi:osmotically-inducible protein OsmY
MKAKLVATLAAVTLSIPAIAFSADKDAMPKDNMSRDTTPSNMSRDSAAPQKEHGVMSDAMITTKIKAEFAKDKMVSATKIHVDTDNGVVKLGGTAKSKAEVDQAVALAKNVSGVESVRNDIKVQAN